MKRDPIPLYAAILVALVVLFIFLLSACATAPPLVSKVDTVDVPVPVREKCIAAADVPTIPKTHMPATGDTAQLAAGAAADVHDLAGYAENADRLLRRCAAQPKESP